MGHPLFHCPSAAELFGQIAGYTFTMSLCAVSMTPCTAVSTSADRVLGHVADRDRDAGRRSRDCCDGVRCGQGRGTGGVEGDRESPAPVGEGGAVLRQDGRSVGTREVHGSRVEGHGIAECVAQCLGLRVSEIMASSGETSISRSARSWFSAVLCKAA